MARSRINVASVPMLSVIEEQAKCIHPRRGGQEHLFGMGTGDYVCRDCKEPMPLISQALPCCGVPRRPHPDHGASWACLVCGDVWGWVPYRMQ